MKIGRFDIIAEKRPRTVAMITTGLVLLLIMSLAPAVFAQTLEQKRTEAKQSVDRLQQQLEDSMERYNYACFKLDQTKTQIASNQAELKKAEAQLAVNKVRLNGRARAMYMTRQNTLLDVMVNSNNVDQFMVGMEFSKKISQNDARLVKSVKEAKSNLESAQRSLEEQKAAQAAAKNEVASSKADVEGQLSSAKGKLAGVEDQIRQAIAQRARESAAVSTTSSRKSYVYSDPIASRTAPPGPARGGVSGVAYAQLGKPYIWAAAGPNAFDCSGLVMYCYRVGAGISLPHSSYAQAGCGTRVSISELQPGDIVGFRGWGHVGIYVGGGSFIHAPSSGDVVKVSSLSSRGNFCGAVRP